MCALVLIALQWLYGRSEDPGVADEHLDRFVASDFGLRFEEADNRLPDHPAVGWAKDLGAVTSPECCRVWGSVNRSDETMAALTLAGLAATRAYSLCAGCLPHMLVP